MSVSIVKPTVGGDSGVWGEEINAALDVLVAGINNLQGLLGSSYLTTSAITSLLAGYASPSVVAALNAQMATKADVLPHTGNFIYDESGNLTGSTDGLTLTYDGQGRVSTISDGTTTRTLHYSGTSTAPVSVS